MGLIDSIAKALNDIWWRVRSYFVWISTMLWLMLPRRIRARLARLEFDGDGFFLVLAIVWLFWVLIVASNPR